MTKKKPTLLLQTCCAPCFTAVFEQLKEEFDVTIFWFNPNIYPKDEYQKRFSEVERYAKIVGVNIIGSENNEADSYSWVQLTKNNSGDPEGGKRCEKCIKYRLLNTAEKAIQNKFDRFATTLTVSPHKDSLTINQIGNEIGDAAGIKYLDRDFIKNDGYKRSVQLCKDFNIYRQKYCGCQYSIR